MAPDRFLSTRTSTDPMDKTMHMGGPSAPDRERSATASQKPPRAMGCVEVLCVASVTAGQPLWGLSEEPTRTTRARRGSARVH